MPRTLSDILRRFRPAAAPGPAAPAGVPVDRVASAVAELAPVFASLRQAIDDAEQVRSDARTEGDRRERAAAAEAERIVATARQRVPAVRSEAAAAEVASLDEQCADIEQDARADAARVHESAAARRPQVVAVVVDRLWRDAGLGSGGPSPSPGVGGSP